MISKLLFSCGNSLHLVLKYNIFTFILFLAYKLEVSIPMDVTLRTKRRKSLVSFVH